MIRLITFLVIASLGAINFVSAQNLIVDKVVAKVGSEYILLSEVEDEYAYAKSNEKSLTPDAKCGILENIIAQKNYCLIKRNLIV